MTAVLGLSAAAQQPINEPDSTDFRRARAAAASFDRSAAASNEKYFFKNLALDQKAIWTSPAHITGDDLKWLVPSSGIATGLFVTDPAARSPWQATIPNAWKDVSTYGIGAAFGTTAAMYAWGHITNRRASARNRRAGDGSHARCAADAVRASWSTGRLRPYQSNYQNDFFDGGSLSLESRRRWRGRLPRWWRMNIPIFMRRLGAYGLATGVSLGARRGQSALSLGRVRRRPDWLPGGPAGLQDAPQSAAR